MAGKNLLWCSRQHGHSVQTMTTTYGVWIEGATTVDAARPRAARMRDHVAPAVCLDRLIRLVGIVQCKANNRLIVAVSRCDRRFSPGSAS
jgi:hypothetical protein